MSDKLTQEILERLAQPFRADQVRWKPQVVTDAGRALAVAYVDPRVVAERLDQVVGGEWSFHWEPLGVQGDRLVVKSSLTVMGVTREDVGEHVLSDREQADPWKSAVSDAFKRSAVHFGVARYLYWLETVWCNYDRRRREFLEEPYIDEAGVVRVRSRQPEQQRSGAGQARTSEQTPARTQEQTPARTQQRPRPSPSVSEESRASGQRRTGRQEESTRPQRRVQEGETSDGYGVAWADEFYTWAGRYLGNQGIEGEEPQAVHRELAEQGHMEAELSEYAALSDAQGAFIRALPSYREGKAA